MQISDNVRMELVIILKTFIDRSKKQTRGHLVICDMYNYVFRLKLCMIYKMTGADVGCRDFSLTFERGFMLCCRAKRDRGWQPLAVYPEVKWVGYLIHMVQ